MTSIASSASELADLLVIGGSGLAELGHLAEYRDASPVAGSLREVLERGAHRVRVGVVRVVDHEAATRQRRLLAAPRATAGCRGRLV